MPWPSEVKPLVTFEYQIIKKSELMVKREHQTVHPRFNGVLKWLEL